MMEPSLLQFYISRQWLNKFKTFAEPGPISNDDFLCLHGGACGCVVVILKLLRKGKSPAPGILSYIIISALCINVQGKKLCSPLQITEMLILSFAVDVCL